MFSTAIFKRLLGGLLSSPPLNYGDSVPGYHCGFPPPGSGRSSVLSLPGALSSGMNILIENCSISFKNQTMLWWRTYGTPLTQYNSALLQSGSPSGACVIPKTNNRFVECNTNNLQTIMPQRGCVNPKINIRFVEGNPNDLQSIMPQRGYRFVAKSMTTFYFLPQRGYPSSSQNWWRTYGTPLMHFTSTLLQSGSPFGASVTPKMNNRFAKCKPYNLQTIIPQRGGVNPKTNNLFVQGNPNDLQTIMPQKGYHFVKKLMTTFYFLPQRGYPSSSQNWWRTYGTPLIHITSDLLQSGSPSGASVTPKMNNRFVEGKPYNLQTIIPQRGCVNPKTNNRFVEGNPNDLQSIMPQRGYRFVENSLSAFYFLPQRGYPSSSQNWWHTYGTPLTYFISALLESGSPSGACVNPKMNNRFAKCNTNNLQTIMPKRGRIIQKMNNRFVEGNPNNLQSILPQRGYRFVEKSLTTLYFLPQRGYPSL